MFRQGSNVQLSIVYVMQKGSGDQNWQKSKIWYKKHFTNDFPSQFKFDGNFI